MADLNVSNIQHFSVGDGPGIRTTVFLKGCNLHCPWCHNPETISPAPQILFFHTAKKEIYYGKQMSVASVLADVLEDMDFYRTSNGGVTISGGEPLLQASAVAKLFEQLQKYGVHTLIDTAGCVSWEQFEMVLPYTDCFFFDWKTPDPKLCSTLIGGNLNLIAENLRKLIAAKKDVHVRIPLIPTVNCDTQTCLQICALLQEFGAERVDLLPFHRLGSGKYDAMGISYQFRDTRALSKEEIKEIADIYQEYFSVVIEK